MPMPVDDAAITAWYAMSHAATCYAALMLIRHYDCLLPICQRARLYTALPLCRYPLAIYDAQH